MRKVGLRYCFYAALAFTSIPTGMAQTRWIDSLKNELKKLPEDSVRLFIYTQLGNQYFSYDTLLSAQYLEKGYAIAKKMQWDYALGDYYQIKGGLKQFSSDNVMAGHYLDSAINFYTISTKKGIDTKNLINAKLSIATCLGQKADLLADLGKQAEAIPVYITALEAWKTSDDPQKNLAIGIFYEKIATAYYNLKLYEKSLFYDKLYLLLCITGNNLEAKAHAYTYVSDDFIALKKIDSALAYLNMAKPIVLKLNNHRINLNYYNKVGQIAIEKKQYRQAIPNFEKAVSEAVFTNAKQPKANNERLIALCYSRMGDYNTSRKYLLMALPTAITGKYVNDEVKILQDLVTTEDKDSRPAAAYGYLKKLVALKDSVNAEETKTKISEIENKYQASEKEKTIIHLQNDRKLQTLSLQKTSAYNYLLLALLSAVFIAALLAYRIIRHRNMISKKEAELHQQKISELEKDKQLVAVDSMLQGQEDERSRLAKDLHDGLGGLLSGVKFSLSNMKDNLIITPDNMAVFERSLDMLDTSIGELRRVAHNMMPEILTKFGLDEALREYCNTINATNLLAVKYQPVGMNVRIEKSAEIIIYRIIQELLNNILKHAAATEATVQLVKEEGRLSIIVEDDGKGFDTALIKNNKGAGLTSIQSRVDYLKGLLDIHSSSGKGTLVNIELNI